jgi:hypothetical protein
MVSKVIKFFHRLEPKNIIAAESTSTLPKVMSTSLNILWKYEKCNLIDFYRPHGQIVSLRVAINWNLKKLSEKL